MKYLTRRTFIKNSTLLTIGTGLMPKSFTTHANNRILGANDKIRIGIIGCGTRGNNVFINGIYKHAVAMNVEIVALCDPWRIAREKANEKVRELFGRDAKQFISYKEMLELDYIDAVMIASPDHLHTTHLEAAAKAKKHIYVEKPLAMEFDKLIRAVDAVNEAKVIVQVGTQLRSIPGLIAAKQLYKEGKIGKLSRVEECRNSSKPYWYKYLRDVKEEDVDWKEFIGDRSMRPFSAEMYSAWYGYYDFSHGPIPNLGSHFIDMVHFITDAGFPESCICLGDIFTWKDKYKFTTPDCIQATWIYPEGFLVSSSNNFGNGSGNVRNFYGNKGVLKINNWNSPVYSTEGSLLSDTNLLKNEELHLNERPDHFLNWLQCIRNKESPIAPINAGYQHAVAVLMAMKSYETGRKTMYDQKRRRIITS